DPTAPDTAHCMPNDGVAPVLGHRFVDPMDTGYPEHLAVNGDEVWVAHANGTLMQWVDARWVAEPPATGVRHIDSMVVGDSVWLLGDGLLYQRTVDGWTTHTPPLELVAPSLETSGDRVALVGVSATGNAHVLV